MRVKIPEGKMVVQCSKCLAVGIRGTDGKMRRTSSIVEFPNLPKKLCYTCKPKKEN